MPKKGAANKVYGQDVATKAAVAPGNLFMHMQAAFCCVLTFAAVICVVFSVQIANEIEDVPPILKTPNVTMKVPDSYRRLEVGTYWGTIAGYIAIPVCLIIGGVTLFLARWALKSKENMHKCLNVEKCCSCFATVFWGGSFFIYFIILVFGAEKFWDVHRFCQNDVAELNEAANASPNLTYDQMKVCLEWTNLLKIPVRTTAVWVGILLVLTCIGGALCGAGAKYAGETEKALGQKDESDPSEEKPAPAAEPEAVVEPLLPPLVAPAVSSYVMPTYSMVAAPQYQEVDKVNAFGQVVERDFYGPATTAYAAPQYTYAAAPVTTAYAAPAAYQVAAPVVGTAAIAAPVVENLAAPV